MSLLDKVNDNEEVVLKLKELKEKLEEMDDENADYIAELLIEYRHRQEDLNDQYYASGEYQEFGPQYRADHAETLFRLR